MARTAQNPRIVNRTGRAKLSARRDPYWHLVAEGQHLGYRRNELGGTWIARYYSKDHGRRFQSLGNADDTAPANGTHVLSFQQALEAAQSWIGSVTRADASGTHVGPYTVADAASAWLRRWQETGSDGELHVTSGRERSYETAKGNVTHHILPTLGSIEVRKLTVDHLEKWLSDLATKEPVKVQRRRISQEKLPPSRRSKRIYDPNDAETQRKRRDSANRVFTDLKSLLNRAYKKRKVEAKVWQLVEKLPDAQMVKVEYLTAEEARLFIASCPSDFRNLVYAALATGCRYAELCDLRVSALDKRDNTLFVIQPKTGTPKRIHLTEEEMAFFVALTSNKQNSEHVLTKSDGTPWKHSNQQQRMTQALEAAGIRRKVRFHDLRHTLATLLIQNGASIEVIANQLGHSGTAITLKHYAHLSPDYVGRIVRANKPSFGTISS